MCWVDCVNLYHLNFCWKLLMQLFFHILVTAVLSGETWKGEIWTNHFYSIYGRNATTTELDVSCKFLCVQNNYSCLQVYMIYFQINYLDIFKYVNEINTKSTILSQSNVLYIRKAKTEYLIRSFTVYRCDLSLRFTCKPFLESL